MDIHKWIHEHKEITTKVFLLVILTMGILFVIGAIKDWDWLYKADEHYQYKWSLKQASRYLGRNVARVIGLVAGILFIIIGIAWTYFICIKKP